MATILFNLEKAATLWDRQYHPPLCIVGDIGVYRINDNILLRFVPTECSNRQQGAEVSALQTYSFEFDLQCIKGYTLLKNPPEGHPYFVFHLEDGQKKGPVYFADQHKLQTLVEHLSAHLMVSLANPDLHFFTTKMHDPDAMHRSLVELNFFTPHHKKPSLLNRFFTDPYATALSGLGRVTKVASDGFSYAYKQREPYKMPNFKQLHKEESLELTTSTDEGFEVLTKAMALPSRKDGIRRKDEVTEAEFRTHLDSEGRVTAVESLRLKIFKGGVHPSLRKTLYPYLLEYIPWSATSREADEIRRKKSDDYYRIKAQWKSIDADQESRFAVLRDRRSLIDKDVNRTDRVQTFFQEQSAGLTMLYDILMTYGMYNFDLGYVQGMSDLLSPLLVALENEADTFWCFAGFVKRLQRNFDEDQSGTKLQLSQLHALVSLLQPDLASYLHQQQSSNMYFCFRWLVVWFKREFSFQEILHLWEVLWSEQPCANFHLLCCCAILEAEKHEIIHTRLDFTGILKHINDTALNIDLEKTLLTAEAMYNQLTEMDRLPVEVAEILGFPPQPAAQQSAGNAKPGSAHRVQ